MQVFIFVLKISHTRPSRLVAAAQSGSDAMGTTEPDRRMWERRRRFKREGDVDRETGRGG